MTTPRVMGRHRENDADTPDETDDNRTGGEPTDPTKPPPLPPTDIAVPFLRIVRGDPTATEIAALVAVLATAAVGAEQDRRRRPSVGAWSAPAVRMRRVTPAGPGGWRASAAAR